MDAAMLDCVKNTNEEELRIRNLLGVYTVYEYSASSVLVPKHG